MTVQDDINDVDPAQSFSAETDAPDHGSGSGGWHSAKPSDEVPKDLAKDVAVSQAGNFSLPRLTASRCWVNVCSQLIAKPTQFADSFFNTGFPQPRLGRPY